LAHRINPAAMLRKPPTDKAVGVERIYRCWIDWLVKVLK
jgi:hypothetical protein